MRSSRQNRSRPASRAGVITGLVAHGVDRDLAERWCDLWEAEAIRQGIDSHRDHYWDAAKGWIDAHRGSTKPIR